MAHNCAQRPFDQNHPKYFCLCGRCHVLTGSKIIAFIHAILIGVAIGLLVFFRRSQAWESPTAYIVPLVLHVIVVGSLWHGILCEREGYLIPFMVHTVYAIIYAVYFSIWTLFREDNYEQPYFSGYSYWYDRKPTRLYLLKGAALIALTIVLIWSFFLVKKAYDCIQHKRFSVIYGCVHNSPKGYVAVPQADTPPPAYSGEQDAWKDTMKNSPTCNSNTSERIKEKFPVEDV